MRLSLFCDCVKEVCMAIDPIQLDVLVVAEHAELLSKVFLKQNLEVLSLDASHVKALFALKLNLKWHQEGIILVDV